MRGCALRVGGITPLSTVDYPGQLACVLFCQGCPWQCTYCHNTHLIPANVPGTIDWPSVEDFLQTRIGLLDAVVFSGGEPTAQPAIVAAAAFAHGMGFKVGVHSSGAYPERLSLLLPYCDWVGLDIKTSDDLYAQLTGSPLAASQVWQSLDRILRRGLPYEVRTTVHWDLLTPSRLLQLAQRLHERGVQHYAVQLCQTRHGAAKALSPNKLDHENEQFIRQHIAPLFKTFELRHHGTEQNADVQPV